MTNVKLKVCRITNGDPEAPGQIISVPDDEAERMIADHQADAVDEGDKKPETRKAVKKPAETR